MKTSFIGVLLLLVPVAVNAGELNYNYIQASYVTSDTDVAGINVDGDGYAISGSFAIADNLAFRAGFEDYSYDFDISTNALVIGVDFHTPLSTSADVVLGAKIIKAEVSQPLLGSDDDTGNIISAGIRFGFSEKTEFEVDVARLDVFDDTTTSFGAAVAIGVSNNLSLGIGYSTSDDTDAIIFGLRAYF